MVEWLGLIIDGLWHQSIVTILRKICKDFVGIDPRLQSLWNPLAYHCTTLGYKYSWFFIYSYIHSCKEAAFRYMCMCYQILIHTHTHTHISDDCVPRIKDQVTEQYKPTQLVVVFNTIYTVSYMHLIYIYNFQVYFQYYA